MPEALIWASETKSWYIRQLLRDENVAAISVVSATTHVFTQVFSQTLRAI